MIHTFHRDDATFAQVDYTDLTNAPSAPTYADQTILGNISGGAAAAVGLTPTQATALLNAFTSALKGLVPASGGGTSNYLRADGSWAVPTLSRSWNLITSVSASGGDQTFTDLGSYASIMVVGRALTTISSTTRLAQVSIDNGSTFLNSSGDYVSLTPSTGAEVNGSTLTMTDATTSARGFWLLFPNWNSAAAGKIVLNSSSIGYRLGTASALNAIIIRGNASSLNGGNIDVFGIPA